jgi:hypothetical protein
LSWVEGLAATIWLPHGPASSWGVGVGAPWGAPPRPCVVKGPSPRASDGDLQRPHCHHISGGLEAKAVV